MNSYTITIRESFQLEVISFYWVISETTSRFYLKRVVLELWSVPKPIIKLEFQGNEATFACAII